jgi:hypothetical protein
MTITRSIFVSIVAVGVIVTLNRVSYGHGEGHEGHESQSKPQHKPQQKPQHKPEYKPEHKLQYKPEHETRRNEHQADHRDAHHDSHHEWHRDAHHDWHRDAHHEEHHAINQKDWYKHQWWHHQASWHNHEWHHWWHHPTTNEVAAWTAGLGLAAPLYYDYGPDGNVVYRNNQVYLNGNPVGTADAYSKSAYALADAGSTTDTTNEQADQWLPLGSFAVLPSNGDNKPSQTLQLAIDKSGNVSGVLFDLVKDTSTPVRGSLDRTTQRVAFDLGAKSGLVAETAIYNLTKDEVPLLVHKTGEKPQNYTLVRFQSPPSEAKGREVVMLSR